MQRPFSLSFSRSLSPSCRYFSTLPSRAPVIFIQDATFYRNHPTPGDEDDGTNRAMFPNLNFSLSSVANHGPHWAIVGPSNAGKTTLLHILRGKHLCLPPTARSFPHLASDAVDPRHRNVSRAIQYVGFDGERGGVGNHGSRGAYLSARYESRREDGDFSVFDYLQGNTNLNPADQRIINHIDHSHMNQIVSDLKLTDLLKMPVGNLSNGQTRRARIAKALLGKPLVLLLDEPFMGLDPPTTASLTPMMQSLAEQASLQLVLALRPQDPLPDWITHLIFLGPSLRIHAQGPREEVENHQKHSLSWQLGEFSSTGSLPTHGGPSVQVGSPKSEGKFEGKRYQDHGEYSQVSGQKVKSDRLIVEMNNVHVKYGQKEVLGDWEVRDKANKNGRRGFWWNVRRGDRWGVFGPNGSGKTTLISLICSDHPLSYSLPIKIFGRSRLPEPGEPGISVFDIQARIGQSSPEIHAFFPRNLTTRQVVENAWAETFLGKPKMTYQDDMTVDACLRWFEAELNPAFDLEGSSRRTIDGKRTAQIQDLDWADLIRFGELPFSAQRVALFLRAIIKKPELVVLDEAFSGMDEYVRDKCMLFLSWGERRTITFTGEGVDRKRSIKPTRRAPRDEKPLKGWNREQTLICVSHVKEEVPGLVNNWVSLPEAGTGNPARFGKFTQPLDLDPAQWERVWKM